MRRVAFCVPALVSLCAVLHDARAEPPSPAEPDTVVAIVGSEPVYARDVARMLRRAGRGKKVRPAVLPVFQAQVLSEIVDRRLVLAYASRTESGATEEEVDAALSQLAAKLKAQGKPLDDFLNEQAATQADLRRQITWNVTWEKFLAKYVTEERLASYFKAHRRELDGTEIAVSHVLLRPRAGDHPEAVAAVIERARTIRREITSGKISFAEAAQKYSAGPSAKDGGRLGFIGPRGPMVEPFSRAAFALEVGEISQPVTTPFGVHLIRCDQIKSGTKQLDDVRKEVADALARELLEKLARYERQYTPVEFTGKSPYFKPGTQELVVP
jgi:parvulin-like peptidyl-prolyl isomerase